MEGQVFRSSATFLEILKNLYSPWHVHFNFPRTFLWWDMWQSGVHRIIFFLVCWFYVNTETFVLPFLIFFFQTRYLTNKIHKILLTYALKVWDQFLGAINSVPVLKIPLYGSWFINSTGQVVDEHDDSPHWILKQSLIIYSM